MKQTISPGIIALAAAMVLAILGFIAYKVLSPPEVSKPILSPALSTATPPPGGSREDYYRNGGGRGGRPGYAGGSGQGYMAPGGGYGSSYGGGSPR